MWDNPKYYLLELMAVVAPTVRDVLMLLFTGAAAAGTIAATWSAVHYARKDRQDRVERDRKAQASTVTVWLPPWTPVVDPVTGLADRRRPIVVSNGSGSSIYEVGVGYGIAYGAGSPYYTGENANAFALQVPPGDWVLSGPPYEGGDMHRQVVPTVAFRDSSGASWIRTADGRLESLPASPMEALGEPQPYGDWRQPHRLASSSGLTST